MFKSRAIASLVRDRYFYELVLSYSDLLSISAINDRLLDAHAPVNIMQHMQVVLEVFPSMWEAPEGRLPLPEVDEPSLGCHAVSLNGWADGGTSLTFRNSYGPSWGNNGCGVLTKEYADLYLREAWTERMGRCGPTSENWETVMSATGFDLGKAWFSSEKAVMGTMRARRQRFDYRYYPVVTFSLGCVVEVIEICRHGEKKREGWAHLYHIPPKGERRSVLRELFVIPEARRLGVGTALERFAKERTVDRAADVLQIDFNEADAYGSSMEAAQSFASRCGYEWMAGSTMHSSIHSSAQKNRQAPASVDWWLSG